MKVRGSGKRTTSKIDACGVCEKSKGLNQSSAHIVEMGS